MRDITLAWAIILYGLAASVLPVWLLLAPRGYLSTFMKLGTIFALAFGIFIVLPDLKMPAISRFVDGSAACFTGDLLASLRCDCGDQLRIAMEMIGQEGAGVLVYLPQEGRGIGLIEKIKAYRLQDQGMDTVEANLALGHQADSRDYGIGIQILKDLGLSKVRLLTNNPKKTDAFIYGGFDLEVVDQVPIVGPIHEHNARYIATKRDKMGHKLP